MLRVGSKSETSKESTARHVRTYHGTLALARASASRCARTSNSICANIMYAHHAKQWVEMSTTKVNHVRFDKTI